jgi:hypothetical protein
MIGPSHGIAVEATFYQGKCHYELHEYKVAEFMFGQALQQQEQIFGQDHDKARLTRWCLEGVRQKAMAQYLQKAPSGIDEGYEKGFQQFIAQSLRESPPGIAESLEKARQKALAKSRREPLPAMVVDTSHQPQDPNDSSRFGLCDISREAT